MEKFKKVQSIVSGIADDADKFYAKNNKAAGTRVRKAMQELKNLAQEIRKEVQDIKNKQKQEAAASKTTKTTSAKKTDSKKAASSKTSTAKTSTKKK